MQTTQPYRWHDFDRWVTMRYLGPGDGTAKLIGAWYRPNAILRTIRDRFPACRIVESYSGGREHERFRRALEAAEAAARAEMQAALRKPQAG